MKGIIDQVLPVVALSRDFNGWHQDALVRKVVLPFVAGSRMVSVIRTV
jgi:hypothetical protein